MPHSKLYVTSGVARRANGTTASGGNINILNKKTVILHSTNFKVLGQIQRNSMTVVF